ncbi:MAG: AP-3 complex subunit beta [Caeruleum heppii]|nr:MAG: AP-3 complex subunit beta [Caeruleum heppii]
MESISRISSMLETGTFSTPSPVASPRNPPQETNRTHLLPHIARDLTLEAAQSATTARSLRPVSHPPKPLPPAVLKKLLDNRNDRDVLDGLRRVISMIYRSQPTRVYFSSVIKNVASPSLEVRKLVYIYLVHHAEHEPDLALLSINTIQKSLSDGNPQVRALALKVMSAIRVPVISQIVSLAIKKGVGDMSPHVRKAAALAIPKCYRLDPATEPQLLGYLTTLLVDKQYFVVGAAVMAFLEVCPDRIDLVHKHYRSLARKLVDMDEWGQLATLRLMLFYARRCFPRRTKKITTSGTDDFYGEDNGNDVENEEAQEVEVLEPDLEMLLKAMKPLLQSHNSAVVMAVARCYLYLAPAQYLDLAIGPLIALLRSPQDIQQIALYNIVSVCLARPASFVRYATHFLIHTTDPPDVWQLKLEVLTLIFPHCETHLKGIILSELEHFSRTSNAELVRESVRAIGRCAQSDPLTATRCLRLLLGQISSPNGNLVAESLTVTRHLVQQDPSAHTGTVIRLAKNLDTTHDAHARAGIIWLVGEFAGVGGENNIAADVLRILAKGFADESETAKLQIVLLAAKVYVHFLNRTQLAEGGEKGMADSVPKETEAEKQNFHASVVETATANGKHNSDQAEQGMHPIALLWQYILLLARYDVSYDLRDRARMYRALLVDPSSTQLATLLLLAPKPVPHAPSPSKSRQGLMLGSTSLAIGQDGGSLGLQGDEALPEWVEPGKEPDPSLREDPTAKADGGEKRELTAAERLDRAIRGDGRVKAAQSVTNKVNGLSSSAKDKSLDDWLAEGDAEVQEGTEESSEEDEEETSEGEEEDDDSEDESSEESSDDESEGADEGNTLMGS